jgi:hypothetical protein
MVLFAVSGCIVLPKTTTTVTPVRTYETGPLVSPVGALQIEARVTDASVHVQLSRARTCRREQRTVMQKRSEESLHLVFGDIASGDDYTFLFLAALDLVVLPASLIVSGIVVAASSPETSSYETAAPAQTWPCPLAAGGIAVELVLASGSRVALTTDPAGAISYPLPAGEPPQGAIAVRAATVEARLTYP